jgi:hypothetical protein
MKRTPQKELIWFFVLEIAVTVLAIVSFKFIPVRVYAGLLAGLGFLSQGTYIFWRIRLWKKGWMYLTFWAATVHLGFSTIPMLITYLVNWNEGFHQMNIWGMPGPVFHYLSEKIFVALMVATIIDYLRVRFLDLKKFNH